MKDVFLCHASEDKETVVNPLYESLEKAGISCWLDRNEIQWGDSITQSVNHGMSQVRFVIVVVSEAFLAKPWPKRELHSNMNIEASSHQVRVLPLVFGDSAIAERFYKEFPLLNDKRHLVWNGDPTSVVDAMLERLGRAPKAQGGRSAPVSPQMPAFDITLPKIKKRFTDFEKKQFLKDGFRVFREYFGQALDRLDKQEPRIQTELEDVSSQKFLARIYMDGTEVNGCNIRIGGLGASDSISYSEGRFSFHNENAINESVTVEDDGDNLYFKLLFGSLDHNDKKTRLTPTEAAQSLWKRFSERLESL